MAHSTSPQKHLPLSGLSIMLPQSSPQSYITRYSKDLSSPSHTDRLSMLPIELKIALLASMPDLETLRTVTLSVPGFYTAYKNRQRHILFHVLSNDLSPELLGEACSLHAVGLINRDKPGWAKATKKFIIAYEVDRTLGVSLGDQNVAILRELAIQHLTIQQIASNAAMWAARNRPDIFECPYLRVNPPSVTERTRFYRAFYHYEIFSAMFGRTPEIPLRDPNSLRLLYYSRVAALLDSYHPHEIEEQNCVRHYIHMFYQELLKRHSLGLGVKIGETTSGNLAPLVCTTPFRQHLYQPESGWLGDASTHCTALGLSFLHKITTAKSPNDELHLLKTQAWFSAMLNPNIDIAIDNNGWPRLDRRISWFARRRDLYTAAFKNDMSGPNAGISWAATSTGTAHTLRSVGTKSGWNSWLLSWGYAMWDSERLDQWGILRSDHPTFNGIVEAYGRLPKVGN